MSGSKTLLWTLSFAYVAGYREIVLHGFDFSQDYAYASASEDQGQQVQPNVWVSDPTDRSTVLHEVARLEKLLSARGVALSQWGCDGLLTTILPAHRAGA